MKRTFLPPPLPPGLFARRGVSWGKVGQQALMVVSRVSGIPVREIIGRRRTGDRMWAKFGAAWLMALYTPLSEVQARKLLGYREHTGFRYAVISFERWRAAPMYDEQARALAAAFERQTKLKPLSLPCRMALLDAAGGRKEGQ
jgi:hypothetical protein